MLTYTSQNRQNLRHASQGEGGCRLERDGSVMRGGVKNAEFLRDVIWVQPLSHSYYKIC